MSKINNKIESINLIEKNSEDKELLKKRIQRRLLNNNNKEISDMKILIANKINEYIKENNILLDGIKGNTREFKKKLFTYLLTIIDKKYSKLINDGIDNKKAVLLNFPVDRRVRLLPNYTTIFNMVRNKIFNFLEQYIRNNNINISTHKLLKKIFNIRKINEVLKNHYDNIEKEKELFENYYDENTENNKLFIKFSAEKFYKKYYENNNDYYYNINKNLKTIE